MFPAEVLPQMFANIKSIYKFHAEFLLPQVKKISFIFSSRRQQQIIQVYIPFERNQLYKIFRKFYPIRKLLLVGMDYFLSLYGIYLWNISIYHL